MTYLLDTNVISESRRKDADPKFLSWFSNIPDELLYASVLSIGEIRYGISKLPAGKKKEELSVWLEYHLPSWFGDRFLAIDPEIMNTWGVLCANHRSLPLMDSLFAASALTHNLTLVTRNTKDFKDIQNLKIINPWKL